MAQLSRILSNEQVTPQGTFVSQPAITGIAQGLGNLGQSIQSIEQQESERKVQLFLAAKQAELNSGYMTGVSKIEQELDPNLSGDAYVKEYNKQEETLSKELLKSLNPEQRAVLEPVIQRNREQNIKYVINTAEQRQSQAYQLQLENGIKTLKDAYAATGLLGNPNIIATKQAEIASRITELWESFKPGLRLTDEQVKTGIQQTLEEAGAQAFESDILNMSVENQRIFLNETTRYTSGDKTKFQEYFRQKDIDSLSIDVFDRINQNPHEKSIGQDIEKLKEMGAERSIIISLKNNVEAEKDRREAKAKQQANEAQAISKKKALLQLENAITDDEINEVMSSIPSLDLDELDRLDLETTIKFRLRSNKLQELKANLDAELENKFPSESTINTILDDMRELGASQDEIRSQKGIIERAYNAKTNGALAELQIQIADEISADRKIEIVNNYQHPYMSEDARNFLLADLLQEKTNQNRNRIREQNNNFITTMTDNVGLGLYDNEIVNNGSDAVINLLNDEAKNKGATDFDQIRSIRASVEKRRGELFAAQQQTQNYIDILQSNRSLDPSNTENKNAVNFEMASYQQEHGVLQDMELPEFQQNALRISKSIIAKRNIVPDDVKSILNVGATDNSDIDTQRKGFTLFQSIRTNTNNSSVILSQLDNDTVGFYRELSRSLPMEPSVISDKAFGQYVSQVKQNMQIMRSEAGIVKRKIMAGSIELGKSGWLGSAKTYPELVDEWYKKFTNQYDNSTFGVDEVTDSLMAGRYFELANDLFASASNTEEGIKATLEDVNLRMQNEVGVSNYSFNRDVILYRPIESYITPTESQDLAVRKDVSESINTLVTNGMIPKELFQDTEINTENVFDFVSIEGDELTESLIDLQQKPSWRLRIKNPNGGIFDPEINGVKLRFTLPEFK